MEWQAKYLLVIDEGSVLGSPTPYAMSEQLCMLRGSKENFGEIPIVVFCGDFHRRPVRERPILLPSTAIRWDEEKMLRAEQRYRYGNAYTPWKKFRTVVVVNEQVPAAEDAQPPRLLKRIRQGV